MTAMTRHVLELLDKGATILHNTTLNKVLLVQGMRVRRIDGRTFHALERRGRLLLQSTLDELQEFTGVPF
jgi:hypothetical protein